MQPGSKDLNFYVTINFFEHGIQDQVKHINSKDSLTSHPHSLVNQILLSLFHHYQNCLGCNVRLQSEINGQTKQVSRMLSWKPNDQFDGCQ